MDPPDFLVIGHVTLDVKDGILLPGGAAFYASLTAVRLGRRVALLTRGMPKEAKRHLTSQAQVVNIPSPTTTTFENMYTPQGRAQRLHSLAPSIEADDLPKEWRRCPVVLLAPVAGEVNPALASLFPTSLLGLSPQGWMRCWGPSGWITPAPWTGEGIVDKAQVLILSATDIQSQKIPARWLGASTTLLLTQGPAGALIHRRQRWFRIPSYTAIEMNPTGAGDVFASAYLIRYNETKDRFTSGLFASYAASLKVEAISLEGIATRAQIEERMDQFRDLEVVPCDGPA